MVSKDSIKDIILKSMEEEEIKESKIDKDYLFSETIKRENEIWEKSGADQALLLALLQKKRNATEKIDKIIREEPSSLTFRAIKRMNTILENNLWTIFVLIIGLSLLVYQGILPILTAFAIFILTCAFFYLEFRYIYLPMLKAETERISQLSLHLLSDLKIETLESDIASIEARIQRSIHEDVLENLRSIINLHLKDIWALWLSKLTAPGLAEVQNRKYEIPTKSLKELELLIESMDGGSIGIAGPRGVGKTVLLSSICNRSIGKKDNFPEISILSYAPVEYDARDFILHLFSSICKKVLGKYDNPHKIELRPCSNSNPYSSLFGYVLRLMSFIRIDQIINIYILSFISLFTGLYIAREMVMMDKTINDAIAMGINPTVFFIYGTIGLILGTGLLTINRVLLARTVYFRQSILLWYTIYPQIIIIIFGFGLIVYSLILSHILLTSKSFFPFKVPIFISLYSYIIAAGVTPEMVANAGFISIALGILLWFFIWNSKDLSAEKSAEKDEMEQRRIFNNPYKLPQEILNEADNWLYSIKFQQSYSSGWSGTLSLPFGIEGGVNEATTLAENQMSLPDIISNYRKFIDRLSSERTILIGIDELDKLRSDEDAQRFLNEIKAIFGLKKVFYFISVSENAMSSFERRGLPFRDVFDSSFDKIILVDYLDQVQAKDLIWKRVIGLPIPFLSLCYCMSGGLARDLIRTCRDMLESVNEGETVPLSQVSKSLIVRDLRAKLKAVSISAKGLSSEPDATRLFEAIQLLEEGLGAPEFAYNDCIKLLCKSEPKASGNQGSNGPQSDKQKEDKEKISRILNELTAYFYYSYTLKEFFNEDNRSCMEVFSCEKNNGIIEEAFSNGKFDLLARSRQYMTVNTSVSKSLINQFRNHHKMMPCQIDD